jgi:hypothetical protein
MTVAPAFSPPWVSSSVRKLVRGVLYRDLVRLPSSTIVRMLDGRAGRLTSWHHSAECVGVSLSEGTTVVIHASRLALGPEGLEQIAPN